MASPVASVPVASPAASPMASVPVSASSSDDGAEHELAADGAGSEGNRGVKRLFWTEEAERKGETGGKTEVVSVSTHGAGEGGTAKGGGGASAANPPPAATASFARIHPFFSSTTAGVVPGSAGAGVAVPRTPPSTHPPPSAPPPVPASAPAPETCPSTPVGGIVDCPRADQGRGREDRNEDRDEDGNELEDGSNLFPNARSQHLSPGAGVENLLSDGGGWSGTPLELQQQQQQQQQPRRARVYGRHGGGSRFWNFPLRRRRMAPSPLLAERDGVDGTRSGSGSDLDSGSGPVTEGLLPPSDSVADGALNQPYPRNGLGLRSRRHPTPLRPSVERQIGSDGRKRTATDATVVRNPYPPGPKRRRFNIEEWSKDNVAVGLRNLGNTCYLNASIQTLLTVPGFADDLRAVYDAISKRHGDGRKSPNTPLTSSLLEVAGHVGVLPAAEGETQSGGTRPAPLVANPISVKKAMDELSDKFRGYEQRDAHEFLIEMIDSLHEELSRAKTRHKDSEKKDDRAAADQIGANEPGRESNENLAKKDNLVLPTDKYFRLEAKVTLTCDCCGYRRGMNELYRHLSIDVGGDDGTWSIAQGLSLFFEPEKREVKCEKCSEGKTATQTMKIISLPKVLLLHLKRFIFTMKPAQSATEKENQRSNTKADEGSAKDGSCDVKVLTQAPLEASLRKNTARVILQEEISLDPFYEDESEVTEGKDVSDALGVDRRPAYGVRAIVNHIGDNSCSGHYMANALRSKSLESKKSSSHRDHREMWLVFDDEVASESSPDAVLNDERNQRSAYMAMYIS